jgi:hypothetical protein
MPEEAVMVSAQVRDTLLRGLAGTAGGGAVCAEAATAVSRQAAEPMCAVELGHFMTCGA